MVPAPLEIAHELSTLATRPTRTPHRTPIIGSMNAEHVSGLGRFLTVADTAEILNTSVGQVYALVRNGELPAIRIGRQGQWRIERDVLEGFIAAKYEESRRRGLWQQADFADLPELFAPAPHRD